MADTYTSFKMGISDFVTIETETGNYISNSKSAVFSMGTTTVEYVEVDNHEEVLLTSEDVVRTVKFRWEIKLSKKTRFFGDAWEDTDCPEVWGEGDDVITYDWYEEAGPTIISNELKYSAYIPIHGNE